MTLAVVVGYGANKPLFYEVLDNNRYIVMEWTGLYDKIIRKYMTTHIMVH